MDMALKHRAPCNANRTYNETRNLTGEEAAAAIDGYRARDEVVPKVVMARCYFPGVPVGVSIAKQEAVENESFAS
jgi:hypothetical protein